MASSRLVPALIATGVGIISGVYIWNQPLQEVTGHGPPKGPIEDGRSQTVKDGIHKDGSPSVASPLPSLREGGASPVDRSGPTIAGGGSSTRSSSSADHSVKIRENPNVHDGTAGGGVGVAEMRERKMAGQGLPSPQGGDTKPRPVEAVSNEGEGGGVPKKGRWWLGGW